MKSYQQRLVIHLSPMASKKGVESHSPGNTAMRSGSDVQLNTSVANMAISHFKRKAESCCVQCSSRSVESEPDVSCTHTAYAIESRGSKSANKELFDPIPIYSSLIGSLAASE